MNKNDLQRLIKASVKVRQMAYSPYSNYRVGAAILTEKGNIYAGCNFENAAFSAGVCAERIAIGNAISNGENKFIAICVSGERLNITPCGICRQALAEFGDITIICCNELGTFYKIYKLNELLPFAFGSDVKNKYTPH